MPQFTRRGFIGAAAATAVLPKTAFAAGTAAPDVVVIGAGFAGGTLLAYGDRETSTYWNGYMDGAVRSGERAAAEVRKGI